MKILWVSRHDMTSEQLESLNNIFKDAKIIQYNKTVNNINEIVSDDIDIYAVVFPAEMLAALYNIVKGKAKIISAVSGREFTGKNIINPATGKEEPECKFVFQHWLEYVKVDIETRILS